MEQFENKSNVNFLIRIFFFFFNVQFLLRLTVCIHIVLLMVEQIQVTSFNSKYLLKASNKQI